MNTTALRLIAAAVALTVAGTAHADIIGTNAGFTFSGSPTVGSFDFSIDATGFENLSLSFDFNAIETEVCDGTFPADCLNVTATTATIPTPNTNPTHEDLDTVGIGSFSGLAVDGEDGVINFRFFFDWTGLNESLEISNIVLEGDAIAPPPPPPPPPPTGVSEPGTLAVLGLGLAGIGVARRRRKS